MIPYSFPYIKQKIFNEKKTYKIVKAIFVKSFGIKTKFVLSTNVKVARMDWNDMESVIKEGYNS